VPWRRRPRAAGGVHRGESARGATHAALEGVVAAGVQDDDVDPVLGLGHLLEQQVHVHRSDPRGRLGVDVGVDGDEEVASPDLQAVAGIVEEADAALGEPPSELHDRALHRALAGVLVAETVKPSSRSVLAIARASFTGFRSGVSR
jgi:hypothetical protein